MRSRALPTVIGAALLAVAALAPPVSAAEPADTPVQKTDPHTTESTVVTLVTGDRVRVSDEGAIGFTPAEGREKVGHKRYRLGGDTYVVPDDASAALAEGRLDRRLFNVTALARDGFGEKLPLILDPKGSGAASLRSIGATALTVDAAQAADLWDAASGYDHIWLDGLAKVQLDKSVPKIGAPTAWQAGFDGTGITVAVLDSGYDRNHPDLAGLVTGERDFLYGEPQADDQNGHGTHVASTVAGSGAASQGRYKGVAPGAKLLVGRVCDYRGRCPESAMIEGLEWAVAQGADVVNLSISGAITDGTDPLSRAVDKATAAGTLVVAAAGNNGAPASVGTPGAAASALTVGSTTLDDTLSWFSSQGPRSGDYAVKPELVAPGDGIVAAHAAGTPAEEPVGDYYMRASGTSMASPHVAGAAAILKQRHPDWGPERLKAALTGSSHGLETGVFETGAGRLDVAAAIATTVTANASSVDFGLQEYPQKPGPVTRTLTYANDGDAPVTLALAATGPFAVASTVDVPAHGTAPVTVSFDPLGAGVGVHGGAITATAPGVTVRTTVSGYTEPERYAVDLTPTARDGETYVGTTVSWYDRDKDTGGFIDAIGTEGKSIRLAPGRYTFAGSVDTEQSTTMFSADVTITAADQALVWDARTAKPVTVDLTDRSDERLEVVTMAVACGPNPWTGLFYGRVSNGQPMYAAGGASACPNYSFRLFPIMSGPGYRYYPYVKSTGGVPADTAFRFADRDLQAEDVRYETQGGTAYATAWDYPRADFTDLNLASPDRWLDVGTRAMEYWGPNMWGRQLYIGDGQDSELTLRKWTGKPGTRQVVRFNGGPIGMAIAPDGDAYYAYGPKGMTVNIGPFSSPAPDSATGASRGTTGWMTLSRDGVELQRVDAPCFGNFAIPETPGRISIACEVSRSVPWSTIGSKSSGEWSVGAVTGGDNLTPGEIMAVRMDATGVTNGYAHRALPQLVSLRVEHNLPGATKAKTLTFEVSYDHGATWKKVPVALIGETGLAVLNHPAGATSVSVRIAATAANGDSAKQTTIDSYGLK
ncbi:serine protease [Actinorhabdospora filicis]|uniref:Serine protease n=1 Tax=Actinorhabdospora filicis TaxID=1785913 RepID=A0A9W6W865_9ACTN|nr:S8 family serine peptidase [Actinorhabdospora filicis]GLZ76658.1 serine protease [Actinorhabdospora filicis]